VRSVGGELVSVVLVLAIPLGIVASFPFSVFGFRGSDVAPRSARTAFVTLTPEAERRALHAVRASWKEKVGGARRLRADLFCPELPEEERLSVLSLRDRSRPPAMPQILCEKTPFLPSQKAPPPCSIAPETEPDTQAFPQKELLRLN